MIQSQQVLEWMAEGEAKGKREGQVKTLLRILRLRFGALALELEAAVRTTSDLDQLDRWVDAAVTSPTLDAFRQSANL